MGPVLNALVKLQSIENRLRAVKGKLARCRRNVILQENQIRTLQNTLEAKKEEIQLTRVQADRLELELKTRDEEIAKLRTSLNVAKTNKEYAAILTQLNTSKADSQKIETQTLELLKDIETDEAEIETIKQQVEQEKQKLDGIRQETEQAAAKLEQEIADIQNEWDAQAKDVPPEPLSIFNRVAETYDGEAIAVVEKQDERFENYSCGGCFMKITAETVNLLMTKDDIIRCPNCTRILVLTQSSETE